MLTKAIKYVLSVPISGLEDQMSSNQKAPFSIGFLWQIMIYCHFNTCYFKITF